MNLPEIAANLSTNRAGDQVTLHWTTPARTTDRLAVRGPITAVVCRRVIQSSAATELRNRGPVRSPNYPCNAVGRVSVAPGESEAVDALPAALRSGTSQLLSYRIALLNSSERSAGVSAPAFAPSGSAPAPVDALDALSTKPGIVLNWSSNTNADPAETVELTRLIIDQSSQQKPPTKPAFVNTASSSKETRFSVSPDVGGSIDRSVAVGQVYSYKAQRVRRFKLGSEDVALYSAPSAPVTVAVRDVFPPDRPTGLVAAPGFRGTGPAEHPTIDLSWDPDLESRLAGYRVYRNEAKSTNGWKLLTAEPIRTPGYSDATVVPGHQYSYRVTAVSDSGAESPSSSEASETAPPVQ